MASKKDFSSINPAMMFATQAEQPKREPEAAPVQEAAPVMPAADRVPPAGYRYDYGIIETKSRRVQLLMQPTLHEALKAKAKQLGLSLNDYIHRVLEAEVFGKEGK